MKYLIAGALLTVGTTGHAADLLRASNWIGSVVTTEAGDDVGKVRDIAIDRRDGTVSYIVVSVASFLIDRRFIAVHPDAISPVEGADEVILNASLDDLERAARFANDGWPDAPDVMPSNAGGISTVAARVDNSVEAEAPTGTALIEGARRTATLSAGEKTITDIPPDTITDMPPDPATARAEPATIQPTAPQNPNPPGAKTKFDELDANGDGTLDRAEIALEITWRDSYARLDENADGRIDRNEFNAFVGQRGELE